MLIVESDGIRRVKAGAAECKATVDAARVPRATDLWQIQRKVRVLAKVQGDSGRQGVLSVVPEQDQNCRACRLL